MNTKKEYQDPEQEPLEQEPLEQAEDAETETPVEEPETPVEESAEEKEHKRKTGSQREKEKRRALEMKLEQMERKMEAMQAATSHVPVSSGPQLSDFGSVEEFLEHRDRVKEEAKRQETMAKAWQDLEKKARVEIEDFDEAFEDFVNSRPSRDLVEAVMESETGPKLAAYLGKNQEDLDRINRLSPKRQILELGKIEAKLIAPKKEIRKTTATAPISPVRSTGQAAIKTTPRNYEVY